MEFEWVDGWAPLNCQLQTQCALNGPAQNVIIEASSITIQTNKSKQTNHTFSMLRF